MDNKKDLPTQSSSGNSLNIRQQLTTYSKKQFFLYEFLFFSYLTLRIGLSIAAFAIILTYNLDLLMQTNSYLRLQQVLDIWSKDVIIDIVAVSTYNCPQGYEQIGGYRWPGTVQGCLCQSYMNDYHIVTAVEGQCPGVLLYQGCLRINPQNQTKIGFWLKDRLLCAKRIPNLNFYRTDTSNQNLTKKCALNSKYQFSIPSNLSCPITEISNKSKILNQTIVGQNQSFYLQQRFSFTRQNNYPIVDFQITQYGFCPQYTRKNISPNRSKSYTLQIIPRTYCGDFDIYGSDPRITEFDSQTEQQFYVSNPRLVQIINRLPVYPQPSDIYQYKLGYVTYPSWSLQCRNTAKYNFDKVKYQFTLFEQQSTVLAYTSISSIFLFLYGLIISLCLMTRRILQLRTKYLSGFLYYNDYELSESHPNLISKRDRRVQFIGFGVMQILGLIAFISLVIYKIWNQNQSDWFAGSKQCTQNYMTEWLDTYKLYFQSLSNNMLKCMLFYLAILLIDIGYLFWRMFKGDLKIYQGINSNYNEFQKHTRYTGANLSVTEQNIYQKQLEYGSNINEADLQYNQMEKVMVYGFPKRSKIIPTNEIKGLDFS